MNAINTVKELAFLGVAAVAILAMLTGCGNTFPTRPLAPVEDHSVKVPPQAGTPPQQSRPSSLPTTAKSVPTVAQTAPLPSLLEEGPVRAEPLPPPPVGMISGPVRLPIASPPAKLEGALGSVPPSTVLPAASPDRGQRPAQRMAPVTPALPGVPATPASLPRVPPEVKLPAVSSPSVSSSNTGVVALLGKADDQAASGQVGPAAATLERALRIEPENGRLWHELAGIRLKQGQLDAAISVAEKSNSLARNQRDLQARNWRLIGVARQQQGQAKAAAEAMLRARSLEGSP